MIEPLCAVICAVYDAGVGVVTVFEVEPPPPPQPANAPAIRSAQTPKLRRGRRRAALLSNPKTANGSKLNETKSGTYRVWKIFCEPVSPDQRDLFSCGRTAALATLIVTVLVPEPAMLAGEMEQLIAA